MKATIERKDLLAALGAVYRVVERRSTIPILSNVHLEVAGDILRLRASDLDIEVATAVAAKGGANGDTTVPAAMFYEIVRKLPDGAQIVLDGSAEDGHLAVRAGRSRFKLQSLPAEDFPTLSAADMTHHFVMDIPELKRLIDKTQFAISTEETRYYLNGIYFHLVDGELCGVATDGHRLAKVNVAVPEGAAGMPNVIIPRKTVGELRRLLEASGTVSIDLSKTKARFMVGDTTLVSKLIDGTFPDYARVIPTNNDKMATLSCNDFAVAVDRVATVAADSGRAMKLSLGAGKLTLSMTNPDSGSADEELEAEYSGEQTDIGFNARYLADILAQIDGDKASVEFSGPANPVLLKDAADPSSMFVLMPMRV